MKRLLAILACVIAIQTNVQAVTAVDSNGLVWNLVGSYRVSDGPVWWDNPPVYSGIEAAEHIFGSLLGGEYATSTQNDFVTHTAFLDGWGDNQYMYNAQPEDWKLDTGNPGYAQPGGQGTAYSAFVRDHTDSSVVNFVFSRDVDAEAVPEFGSGFALLGVAIAGLGVARRRVS